MPGSILPLPIMLDEEDQKIYDKLEVPKSIVVRYAYMRLIAELPYDGDAKPGCGSKLVIRTARGIELGEMLTTTCPNSGCGKSVSRKDMLQYIDNSGGKNFPFTTQGRILRVATVEDMLEQQRLDNNKPQFIKNTRALVRELDLKMKLVDIELLLGGERMIFHYTSEDWVDFRELVKRLAAEYQTRIEMHQVNARDEARIVADYEKCGQHCCCKQFLKVLKPVSMKSAKVQKATLDPTKISGRCGRLMCCLRYEDETYDDLRKRLPKRQTRWMTDDGPGTVIDTQILTQLALIVLDKDNSTAAYPIENITALSREEDAQIQADREAKEAAREPRRERRDDRPPAARPEKSGPPRGEQRGEQRGERGEQRGERGEQRGEQREQRGERGADSRGPRDGGDRPPGARPEARKDDARPDENRKEAPRREDGPRRKDGPRREESRRQRPDMPRQEAPRRDEPRRDQPKRDEPRRPQPGQPLREEEVESREGRPSESRPSEESIERDERQELNPASGNDRGNDLSNDRDIDDGMDDAGGDDEDSTETGTSQASDGGDPSGQPGAPGQGGEGGRKRKRRRRRRRRGGGEGTAPGAGAGPAT